MNTLGQLVEEAMRRADAPEARRLDMQLAFRDAVNELNLREKFWFHNLEFELALEQGEPLYRVPAEVGYISGDLWVSISNDGSFDNRYRVFRRSADYLDTKREYSYSSYPRFWAPVSDHEIRLYPAPDGDHLIAFRGKLDFPPPEFSWDGTTLSALDTEQLAVSHGWYDMARGGRACLELALHNYAKNVEKDPTAATAYGDSLQGVIESLRSRSEDIGVSPINDPWPPLGSPDGA